MIRFKSLEWSALIPSAAFISPPQVNGGPEEYEDGNEWEALCIVAARRLLLQRPQPDRDGQRFMRKPHPWLHPRRPVARPPL
jgi:hypothetical protein